MWGRGLISKPWRRGLFASPIRHAAQSTFSRPERYEGQFEEEAIRRKKLAAAMPTDSLLILSAADTIYMSHDIPYPFRQNTNFFYFTGLEEPEAVLIVDKGENAASTKFLMFVRPRNPQREMWDGKRVGAEGAHQYGADHGLELKDYSLRQVIQERAARKSLVLVDKVPKLLLTEPILPSGIPVQDAKSLIESLRFVKSKREMQLAQAAADISEKGFRAIMRDSHAGVNEHVLSAQLEWECRRHGAQRLAYPPVVAGGERANTLHYITNDLPIRDGEMVLVDGGCELFCFSSDVSRTWPVNGKFSPAQRELYAAVLDAEKQCIQACRKGKSLSQLHSLSIQILSEHLKSLGIMNRHNNDYFRFYPHSIGHYLGMDVHDTSSYTVNQKLQPGNLVTIEPGLYIPKCPHVDPKYHNIGIRIEDNIFVTEDGCVNLTRNIPKEIDEVEAVIQGKE